MMNKLILLIKEHPWILAMPLVAMWVFYAGDAYKAMNTSMERLKIHHNEPDFPTYTIGSKIDSIEYYDKGFPRVTLQDGHSVLLKIPGKAGSEYVQVGDSIVKRAKTDSVTVYRRYPTYTEVRLYGNDPDGGLYDLDYKYSGLLQRYRIPHSPR